MTHEEINRQMQIKCPDAHTREWVKWYLEHWEGEKYEKLKRLAEEGLVNGNWAPISSLVLKGV